MIELPKICILFLVSIYLFLLSIVGNPTQKSYVRFSVHFVFQ